MGKNFKVGRMGGSMMSGKLEAVDLIVDILKEHERSLDYLIARLEAITPTLEKEMNK